MPVQTRRVVDAGGKLRIEHVDERGKCVTTYLPSDEVDAALEEELIAVENESRANYAALIQALQARHCVLFYDGDVPEVVKASELCYATIRQTDNGIFVVL